MKGLLPRPFRAPVEVSFQAYCQLDVATSAVLVTELEINFSRSCGMLFARLLKKNIHVREHARLCVKSCSFALVRAYVCISLGCISQTTGYFSVE